MSLAAQALAAELQAGFLAAGAQPVAPDILQSAETLLDLYGEDIRARAYVTADPARGELMLRPDFTVPVALAHLAQGAAPARYTYSGPVFRRQEADPARASEYLQVGYEAFDAADAATDTAEADAEVFARISAALAGRGLRAVTGDIGILRAALDGLGLSAARHAALLRHLWRPRRFRALLERFAGLRAAPPGRGALLAAADPFATAGPEIGLRSRAEVAARIEALRLDAAEPRLSADRLALIDAVLAVRETCGNALSRLADIAVDLPTLMPAVQRLEARLDALARHGVPVDALGFEASYGRTSMEYYDGFVFGFVADARPDLPPVASGGRYDALTARLAGGRGVRAVGGVIRPDLLLALEAA